jgi:5-methylcytosine-specific restriction endonuclease McrA
MVTFSDLSDNALVGRVVQIRKHERSLLVDFLRCLIELDQRRAVLALGFSSLFSFCVEHLGCSKAAAFRRTTAARLLARFPVVADYLVDGRLNLTTLVELRDVLEESRLLEILEKAAGRTEDQVKELVAALRPQPAPADLLRRLPTPRNDSGGSGPAPGATLSAPAAAVLPVATPPLPRPLTNPPPRLQPIAPERHVLRVTVGARRQPRRVLHECMRVTLKAVENRRRGTGKKTTSKAPPPGSRYVPVAISDEVCRRDEGQCAFVGSTGRHCGSRHQLQLHHLDPSGKGGPTTAPNLPLRCRAHNLHAAGQDYGRDHIAQKIAAARRRKDHPAAQSLPGLG